jgi:electron transfer flavoprotein alpha subunit
MPCILVIAEARRGELRAVSFELIAAALAIKEQAGGPLAVAIVDSEAEKHAGALGTSGVDEVLAVKSPLADFEAHVVQRAVEELVALVQPDLVLAAHSVDALGFAPALAAANGLGFSSDVTAVRWDGGPVVTRGAYGDKLVADYDFPGKKTAVVLLRGGIFDPAPAASGSKAVRVVEVDGLADAAKTEHLAYREVDDGGVDITKAEFLLAIGRGVEERDDIERFEELAEKFGATLSVSRPLVDAGWMPSSRQVGQSGKTVKPRVYLAMGISGAVQHLAGMRGADTIIAVNTDPEAPIFTVAHYGAVTDMFELADALEQSLS